jgi:hypothetical protein
MAVRDERTESLRVQLYRQMTPEERITISAQMFEDALSVVRSSIMDQHPDISPEELEREVRRRVLGEKRAGPGQELRDGSEPYNAQDADIGMTARNVFLQVLEALETLDIPYMIVGSFASTYWGRPRMTHDADLLVEIPVAKVAALARSLAPEFYAPDFVIEEGARNRSQFNAIHSQTAFKVDFWFRQNTPYDRERFKRRQRGTLFGRQVWITTAEDVILSKLVWYRTSPGQSRQLQDALEVYEIQEPDLDRDYLQHWAGVLGVADLLAEIQQ